MLHRGVWAYNFSSELRGHHKNVTNGSHETSSGKSSVTTGRMAPIPEPGESWTGGRMGDPPFQRINGGWQAIVTVTPRPRPCGLDGAEQGVEMIGAGIIGQAVWCFDRQAMGWLDTVFVDEVKYFHSRFVLLPVLFGFAVLLVALAADQTSGQNAGICFQNDPKRVALLQAGYGDTRLPGCVERPQRTSGRPGSHKVFAG